jgi:hypothetical protein
VLDSVVGCLIIAPIWIASEERSDATILAFDTPGGSVPLRSAYGLRLRVRLRTRVGPAEVGDGPWRVRIVAYQYALLDREGREYLAYYWRPEGSSQVTEPHLHLGPAARFGAREIAAAHLPAGPVSLAAVVRLAVEELGARPLRADWSTVLDRAARSSAIPI